MARRFAIEEEEEEGADELNLTPYLDMITTLVIFFVFTFQIVIEFRLIDVMPPEISSKPASSSSAEAEVRPTLFITETGYLLSADGKNPDGSAVAARVVLEKKDGAYDTAGLREKASQLKGEYGMGTSIVLVAHGKVEYKDVIGAMDAVRQTDKGLLFPDVVFGDSFSEGGAPAPAAPAGGTP